MPLPMPKEGETISSFVTRCGNDSVMQTEFPDMDQRIAVCYSRWEKRDDAILSSSKIIVVKSEKKRLVYGEVYSPLHIDTDNQTATADEIEKMAHAFLTEGRTSKIDFNHDYMESGAKIVESFIARKNDPDGFIEGAWVLGVLIQPESLWEKVKTGEINGFSFAGRGNVSKVLAKVQVIRELSGRTELSEEGLLPAHSHHVVLIFNDSGNLQEAKVSTVAEHTHKILRTTATEEMLGHSHRLVIM